jgi:hypothetical protein
MLEIKKIFRNFAKEINQYMENSGIKIEGTRNDYLVETDCGLFWLLTHELFDIDEAVRRCYRDVLKLYIANKLHNNGLKGLRSKQDSDLFGKDLAKMLRNKCHFFWGYEIKGVYVYVKQKDDVYAFGSFLPESDLKNAVVKISGGIKKRVPLKSLKTYSDAREAKKKFWRNVSLTISLVLTIFYMFYKLIAQIF